MAWRRQANNFWTMRVSDEDRERIAVLAQREGVPAAQAVRSLIRKALTETDPRPEPSAGATEVRSLVSVR